MSTRTFNIVVNGEIQGYIFDKLTEKLIPLLSLNGHFSPSSALSGHFFRHQHLPVSFYRHQHLLVSFYHHQHLPVSFFLMVILIFDWLAMSLRGVVGRFLLTPSNALASIRSVCQSTSLNMSTSPRASSLIRVIRRSATCHVGVLLCTIIRESYFKMEIGICYINRVLISLII